MRLSPLFRRKWSSTYEALQDSRPNRNKLMKRYVKEIPSSEYILLAIDHTAWGRRGAKTLQDRTYEHQASSNNSVTVGQGYSRIAWIPEKQGSWALPLRHERITSYEKPISKAAWQLEQACKHLRQKTLVVLDSEYGNGSWVNQTGEIPVSKLMRIRSNCCLWSRRARSLASCADAGSLVKTQKLFRYGQTQKTRSEGKMERFNAFDDLAVVVSQ